MKRTTLFTITHKQWMHAIADYLNEIGHPELIMSWDSIMRNEGGMGESFFNSISDAQNAPYSYPGKWFLSGQTDLSVYSEPQYLYSLFFGMKVVSGSVMSTIGKLESGQQIWDIGGSVFTAYRLLQRGVENVCLTNYPGHQLTFSDFAAKRFKLNAFTFPAEEIAPLNSIMVCSEYLEHFQNVDTELERLTAMMPARIYESSSFCMPAYGHYIPITINGIQHYTPHAARRALYAKMASLGYVKEKVICFNRHFIVFNRVDTLDPK